MKVKETYLGKVSITAEGRWNKTKEYERLSLVYDTATLESYISKIKVPANIEITNEDYWQSYSSFEKQLVIDYQDFQADVLARLEAQNRKIKQSRLVVDNEEERDALTVDDISVGCLVYILDTKHSYILDSIDTNNNKTWHIYDGSLLGSYLFAEFNGQYPEGIADRAISDETGLNIHENYLTKEQVTNYTAAVVRKYLIDNALNILDSQITPSMLSESVKQLFGNRSIVNLADGEDLISVNNILKFADKAYNTTQYSGMARKFLRKHIIDGVNVLTQEMIDKPNTIYILQYDYCLNGETITLPDNSIILWLGGKMYDGTLNINKARIIGVYCFADMFDAETLTTDEDWAVGQIIYMGDTNYYMYWDGEKWLYIGIDPNSINTTSDFEYYTDYIAGRTPVQQFTGSNVNVEPNKYYVNNNVLSTITIIKNGSWFEDKTYAIIEGNERRNITKTYLNKYYIDCYLSDANIILPADVSWHNNIVPTEAGHYQITIVNKIATWVRITDNSSE